MLTIKELEYEINAIEKVIEGKRKEGQDTHFEEGLLKSYKKHLRNMTDHPSQPPGKARDRTRG